MLHVHRSDRADGLIEALHGLFAEPPPDPFAREVIAVPTRGMERWLTQRLSNALGICANVDFPFPRTVVGNAVAAASGIDPATDPWLPERMVWPLLEVVDQAMGEPWMRPLASHLQASRARRFAAVRHLADLFDRYALQRPELIQAWAAGEGEHWQPELWRRLNARLEVPDPASRVAAACARLRAESALADLPQRFSLFGLTRLPAGQLRVLEALAVHRDVRLFLLHPSPALWQKLEGAPRVTRRAEDPTVETPANRLLGSWGHDARELQLVLGPDSSSTEHPVEHPKTSLLARLQAGVREDTAPAGAPHPGHADARPPLDPSDRSVEVHACHGRARQVEVLRDAILHAMEEDAALEPRDVIVMCPDIEVFAPLIQATFGAGDIVVEGDPELAGLPDLRVRLADRSLRQTNPVLGVVARLLELAEERLTASQVIDFADREPVRRRFRLDDDALTRVEEWIADSGIRWGLDAGHRAPFKLEKLDSGTWRKGLDRLLLGVTMSEQDQRLFADVLPLDDVESGSIDLAGRFSELVERLGVAIDALSTSQTVPEWAAAIAAAADALTATSGRDSWQRGELQRLLDDVVREAAGHAGTLELAEIRALLAERLQGRPTRANFRTGHLTICTLVPMRSVPHRVVCLLGLDDAAFPRKAPRDGDDLLLTDPHVGDRDSRTEDRQMLLDALMSATDRLIITYTGNDERTNIARPPAVPVGELLDMADRTARVDGKRVRDHVLVKHPLQPFDPRNYEPGRLVDGKPWSFDHVTLAGARALATDRPKPRAFLDAPLPGSPATVLELEDLARFLSNPVGAFLGQRLEVSVADRSTEPADALPVEVEGLDRWRIGDRMLTARLAGVPMDDAVAAEVARGELPPGSLADITIAEVRPIVEEIVARAGQAQTASVDVRVVLDDGRRVSGTVPHVTGTVLRAVGYSRVGARQRIGAWVRLVALCAAYPDRGYEAVIVGRGQGGVKVVKLPTLSAQDARAELAILADLYDRGMCEPLPIACAPTAAYAEAVRDKRDPEDAARREWESEWNFDKEDVKPEHQLAFDGVLTFDELLARPAGAGEDWGTGETTRFGRLSRRLWDRLLVHEA
ncbi:exodeoxyribonuclease V subunit gamma [Solirubrobacter taibaiensis]|nr:exodeoxyribonuclease V subunit gamma [Solirubrobacter taibaiensis]